MSKLSVYQIWKKKQTEKLSDEQYVQLLYDNDIIVPKIEPSEELITMLTSYVQNNRVDYATEVFGLCKAEILKKLNFEF